MGPIEQTRNDQQAAAFFARFTDASPEVVARLVTELGGNLTAATAEGKAFGYWDRTITRRAARKTARERAVIDAEIAADARIAHPDRAAQRPPLAAESLETLPPRRVVRITDAERRATATYWRHLTDDHAAAVLAQRLRREARRATEHARQAARAEHRAAEQWRLEQRAFERAQWRSVLAQQSDRRRRQIANRWVAISEQRALDIAIAVLATQNPPQDHN